ncbi:peroxidase family protein [Streptomyces sp. NPDC023723]|uniref:peroxidase family protein n=1 Tax=Streptomyces sp. NPDC023723 TaxID=3154323 RepID=UPI0033F0EE93
MRHVIRHGSASRRSLTRTRAGVVTAVLATLVTALAAPSGAAGGQGGVRPETQSLDGGGNNRAHPDWGRAGTAYARLAAANYADGHSEPAAGPDPRYVSNRVFADEEVQGGQVMPANIFSERQVSQWAWTWAQFLDHTFALRLGEQATDPQGESADMAGDDSDPLELIDGKHYLPFTRSTPARGTGVTSARQQVNMDSSYLDASAVYGSDSDRLEWLRQGQVDGDLSDNGAKLLLPDDYLPRRDARGDVSAAPATDIDGRLRADPDSAVVAGDVRVNNNIAVTGVQTLFAREHNRIVDALPANLTEEQKFQIARRVVISEIQYITYTEFLPAVGITLPGYRGYDPRTDATLTNEFATTGYRAHSMIHGATSLNQPAGRYTEEQLEAFRAAGLLVMGAPDGPVSVEVSLEFMRDNPELLKDLGLGPVLQSLGDKAQYRNEEMTDHLLRSVLCSAPNADPKCVFDLAATDLARSRDHGIPSYNDLRKAYGLAPVKSFTGITGEATEAFPSDAELTPGAEVDDPDSVDFLDMRNLFGSKVGFQALPGDTSATTYTRRTPLAARLKAIYGSVDRVDAYVGMQAEPHLKGSEFGELQQAMWVREFQRLRDGDRFFYGNQSTTLKAIAKTYGIGFRHDLADVIAANTDIERSALPDNVFYSHGEVPAGSCRVEYEAGAPDAGGAFTGTIEIKNTGRTPLSAWALRYRYADGQKAVAANGAVVSQNGTDVTVHSPDSGGTIRPGHTRRVSFTGTATGGNADPAGFTLNTTRCSAG